MAYKEAMQMYMTHKEAMQLAIEALQFQISELETKENDSKVVKLKEAILKLQKKMRTF